MNELRIIWLLLAALACTGWGRSLNDELSEEQMRAMDAAIQDVKVKLMSRHNATGRPAPQAAPGRACGFQVVQQRLRPTPAVRQYATAAFHHMETVKALRARDELAFVPGGTLMKAVYRHLAGGRARRSASSGCPIPPDSSYTCDPSSSYRTIDGTCNNLQHPKWGGANRGQPAMLPPKYSDGVEAPRTGSSGPLPSARRVSYTMYEDTERASQVQTIMHMTFGQMLDHDLSKTPVATTMGTGGDVTCGEGCTTQGAGNEDCFPIPVEEHDPDFTGHQCLKFVRSQGGFNDDCTNTVRTQMNTITSWLDASFLYGSSSEVEALMREKGNPARGRLELTPHPIDSALKGLLPVTEGDCSVDSIRKCFVAGDVRANAQVGLSSLHTLWQRAHNTLEGALHAVNPGWGGERLYQETRRLVTAVWQHIVYSEYVPTLLGPRVARKYDLLPKAEGYYTGYQPSVTPDINTEFSTAAFRFGHSQIGNYLRFSNNLFTQTVEDEISNHFFNPSAAYNTSLPGGSGVDAILLGHLTQPGEEPGQSFGKQVTAHLFTKDPPHGVGTDLPALNIQRGRDHGLPGYLDYRRMCGLPIATDFNSLCGITGEKKEGLNALYSSVEDIDLFVGGMAERHTQDSSVGPTFSCILARQFLSLKQGDRFYYENQDADTGFTEAQLDEIRKFTLSRLMCDNLDSVDTIQKYALLRPLDEVNHKNKGRPFHRAFLSGIYHFDSNQRRRCSDLPTPDFSAWAE